MVIARTRALSVAMLAGALLHGCGFLDPTTVENPRTTDEDLRRSPDPTGALLSGLRAQFARMLGSQIVISEVTSDNYSIHGPGILSTWNSPRDVRPTDTNFTSFTQGIYWNMQELRALADFVLDEIVPADAGATPERLAEIHYYREMAYLLQGENFTHVPTEKDAEPRPSSELLQRALADFDRSLSQSRTGNFALPARAATARAKPRARQCGGGHRGCPACARGGPRLPPSAAVRPGIGTEPAAHLSGCPRVEGDAAAPAARFPGSEVPEPIGGIAVAKAEEMHLILAEAALARGELAAARQHLANAIEVAHSRGTTPFTDDDPRNSDDLTIRPRDASILVRADPESPLRAGLILARPGVEIPIPAVSGTSLGADSVVALTDPDEIWHAFHLARQEILFLEGRRMSDLGVRLPMMLREIEQNPGIDHGDPPLTRLLVHTSIVY